MQQIGSLADGYTLSCAADLLALHALEKLLALAAPALPRLPVEQLDPHLNACVPASPEVMRASVSAGGPCGLCGRGKAPVPGSTNPPNPPRSGRPASAESHGATPVCPAAAVPAWCLVSLQLQ